MFLCQLTFNDWFILDMKEECGMDVTPEFYSDIFRKMEENKRTWRKPTAPWNCDVTELRTFEYIEINILMDN